MNTEQIKPEPMSEIQLKGIKKQIIPDIFVSHRQDGLRPISANLFCKHSKVTIMLYRGS